MNRPPDMVAVFADLDRFPEPRRMGSLRRQVGRGGEVFSFEYDRDWLKTSDAFSFDPDLALVQGPQYPAVNRTNFGTFLNSAPDRWGRVLMQRRENLRARLRGARSSISFGLGLSVRRSRRNEAWGASLSGPGGGTVARYRKCAGRAADHFAARVAGGQLALRAK